MSTVDQTKGRKILDRRKKELLPLIEDSFRYHRFDDEENEGHEGHHHGHGHGHGHGQPESTPLQGEHERKHHEEGMTELEKELEEAEEIEEATPIELFYDLFFVANLTTVMNVHYITGYVSLLSYILFFAILWYTWLQVTLYDVRFSVDSLFERVCKAGQLGVMAGFSSVSTTWNPLKPENVETVQALKLMTVLLIVSRALLAIQYCAVLFYARKQRSKHIRHAVLPLGLHIGIMLLAVGAYLGLFFHFHPKSKSYSWITWFAVMFIEAVVVVVTSCIFTIVSFKTTHLVERMGLLTLIVIGEGIILLGKSINAVVNGFGWSPSAIGVIGASLLTIYFFWMLYFDYTPRHAHEYGTKRQQFWSLLHFPYHLAIVLSVEGLRQIAVYRSLSQSFNFIQNSLLPLPPAPALTPEESANWLKTELYKSYYDGSSKTLLKEWPSVTSKLYLLGNMTSKDVFTMKYNETIGSVITSTIVAITESYGVPVKFTDDQKKNPNPWAINGPIQAVFNLFEMVYVYFFIALAVLLICHGIFILTVRREKDKYDYYASGIRGFFAIIMLGMIGLASGDRASLHAFMASGWVIPMVSMSLFVLLLVDKTMVRVVVRRMEKQYGRLRQGKPVRRATIAVRH